MILIDKPIPEDCDYCFCNDDGDKCGLLNESFPLYFSGRLPNCPLREMEKADDPISRQAAIDAIRTKYCPSDFMDDGVIDAFVEIIQELPSVQPEQTRVFVEVVVEYPDPELCTYKELKGKPYYSIKYIENGEIYVGYGTYKPEVLSRYLREYFMPSAQPELVEKAAYIRGFEQGRTQGIIDAQGRKNGKWIKFIPINDGHLWFCDQCGAKLYCDDNKKYPEDNFCCKCGADMRGGEDG